jgi:hypothetical protein
MNPCAEGGYMVEKRAVSKWLNKNKNELVLVNL